MFDLLNSPECRFCSCNLMVPFHVILYSSCILAAGYGGFIKPKLDPFAKTIGGIGFFHQEA